MDSTLAAWLSGFAVGILLVLVAQIVKLQKRVAGMSRIEAKLDLLLKNAGIKYDPYADVSEEVKAAVQSGQKILAIKHYREATGCGLKEAKEFIEEIQRRGGEGGN